VAVVTGGARGIGGGIAAAFAAEGADVVIADVLGPDVAQPVTDAIAPGPINTDMLTEETEEWISNKLAELPIGRFGDVHEVAPTAVFLASDDSSYYVGQTLCPNGGDVML
jgi:3-oxoacyl-[acyl-carrier protein] reductase